MIENPKHLSEAVGLKLAGELSSCGVGQQSKGSYLVLISAFNPLVTHLPHQHRVGGKKWFDYSCRCPVPSAHLAQFLGGARKALIQGRKEEYSHYDLNSFHTTSHWPEGAAFVGTVRRKSGSGGLKKKKKKIALGIVWSSAISRSVGDFEAADLNKAKLYHSFLRT